MDIQLKRGLLEPCVLAVLRAEDSYGYQLVKDISQCIDISESTLYPVLKRLESMKMVAVYTVEHNGRLRKYYQITDVGEGRLRAFMDDWQEVRQIYDFIRSKMAKGTEDGGEGK